jgi:hypothetical protein
MPSFEGQIILNGITLENFGDMLQIYFERALENAQRKGVIKFNDPFESLPDAITKKQISEIFGVSVATVYTWEVGHKIKRLSGFNNPVKYPKEQIKRLWYESQLFSIKT